MLRLDGRQKKELRESIISAFPNVPPLERMTSDYLNLVLATVAAPSGDLEGQVFDLIEWADSRGKLGDLILAARYANPDNPNLYAFAFKLGITSSDHSRDVLEALVSANTVFLDPQLWRAELSTLEWRVCRIDVDEVGLGTGFLVGPDAVLTNYHVVEKAIKGTSEIDRFSCLFDFKMAAEEVLSEGTRFDLVSGDEWLVDSSPYSKVDRLPDPKPEDPGPDELDFALIRLSQPAGDLAVATSETGATRGWVTVSPEAVDLTGLNAISILQHPQRRPLKLALGMEQVLTLNAPGNRVRYTVPTLPGSSGSPVFDSEWRLVALHHSGDPNQHPEFNEGIPISLVATRPRVAGYLESLDDGV